MIEEIPTAKEVVNRLFEHQTTLSETGVVIELREKRLAVVAREQSEGCSGCGASGGCCQSGGNGQRRLLADNQPYARVGDTVRVEIETTAGLADSQNFLYIIAFIMLALGLAVGYFIASLLPVGIPAALLALMIGGAFMVGTLGVFRFGRPAVVQTSLARIVEVITPAEQDDPAAEEHTTEG
ncbi:SoxR reducing system RseC family protein [Desulfuromonas acetoxidans]|uniref:SoxR reducing system RseC family protein n=1 Tax=Desulfuromonas acetoxidans TaxID=891 RepID=UPI002931E933|nr:SoxR reducing system RseC family protein [Desulfuromonas acetoxidans]